MLTTESVKSAFLAARVYVTTHEAEAFVAVANTFPDPEAYLREDVAYVSEKLDLEVRMSLRDQDEEESCD